MPRERVSPAQKLKERMIQCSPLIEEYTRVVCPDCDDVCCKQKVCVFGERDVVYLAALGTEIPPYDADRPPEGPCQFLMTAGCVLPQWLRPFKCTWLFCEPLIKAMDEGPQKKARELLALLEEMGKLFDELQP